MNHIVPKMNRYVFVFILCLALVSCYRPKRRTRSIHKRAAGGGCLYEGKVYQQGQTWTKQCQVNCVCQDGTTGLYKCTDICPNYGTLPKQCQLQKQPNSCCSKPICNFQSSGGGSSGSGSGTIISGGSGSGSGTMTMTGGSSSCQNKRSDCENYGQTVCSDSQYTQWVIENCQAYCNKCGMVGSGGSSGGMTSGGMTGSGGGSGGMTSGGGGSSGGSGFTLNFNNGGSSGSGSCADKLNNCADYGQSVCSDQQYTQWVLSNCQKACNKCGWTLTGGGSGSGSVHYVAPSLGGQTGTGGTSGGMTGTGGTGGGGVVLLPGGSGGSVGTGGTGGFTGGMTGTCADTANNCNQFDQSVCTDSKYDTWVKQNCQRTCNKCGGTGSMTGTGSGTITGTGTGTGTGTMTGTGGTGSIIIPVPNTGGSSCEDKMSNCADLKTRLAMCTDPQSKVFAQRNCPKTCNMCCRLSTIL